MNDMVARYDVRTQKFRKLRNLLRNADINNHYLADLIDRGTDYVSRCLNGKGQWTLTEMYIILDAIGEKLENMHKVFPKDGIDKDFKDNRKGTNDTPAVKEIPEELQLLPPVKVGKIGNRDVFITISYR